MIHTDGIQTIANAPTLAQRKTESKRRQLAEAAPLHPDVEDLARALAATRGLTLAEARESLIRTSQVDANAMADGLRMAGQLLSGETPLACCGRTLDFCACGWRDR